MQLEYLCCQISVLSRFYFDFGVLPHFLDDGLHWHLPSSFVEQLKQSLYELQDFNCLKLSICVMFWVALIV